MTITDEAVEAAVRLSARYINDRFLPDKAIDLMDEAAAKVRLHVGGDPREAAELRRDIAEAQETLEQALSGGDLEAARDVYKRQMGVLAASISAFHGPEAVYAYTATAGTINDGPVKVRNAPVTGDKLTLILSLIHIC